MPVGTVVVRDDHLVMTPTLGRSEPLVPVNDALFRRQDELTASFAFTTVDGNPVLAGAHVYAERRARWPLLVLQASLMLALAAVTLAPVVALGHAWRSRRRARPTAAGIGIAWSLALAVLAGIVAVAAATPVADLGAASPGARALFAGSLAYPVIAGLVAAWTLVVWRRGCGRLFTTFATVVAAAHTGLTGYLAYWGLLGFRTWMY